MIYFDHALQSVRYFRENNSYLLINISYWQVYIVDILVFIDLNKKMADLTRLRFESNNSQRYSIEALAQVILYRPLYHSLLILI